MLRAGVDGLAEGARDAGHDAPIAFGCHRVDERPRHERVRRRARRGDRGGLRWCRVLDARRSARCTRARADFVTIVPGVRLADGDASRPSTCRHARSSRGRGRVRARDRTCSHRGRRSASCRSRDPRARSSVPRRASAHRGRRASRGSSCDVSTGRYAGPPSRPSTVGATQNRTVLRDRRSRLGPDRGVRLWRTRPCSRRSSVSGAREGGRRAPPAGRGQGQAQDRIAVVARVVRPSRPQGRGRRDAREAQGRQRARVAARDRQGERDPVDARARRQRHPPARRCRSEAAREAPARRRGRRVPPRAVERIQRKRDGEARA